MVNSAPAWEHNRMKFDSSTQPGFFTCFVPGTYLHSLTLLQHSTAQPEWGGHSIRSVLVATCQDRGRAMYRQHAALVSMCAIPMNDCKQVLQLMVHIPFHAPFLPLPGRDSVGISVMKTTQSV